MQSSRLRLGEGELGKVRKMKYVRDSGILQLCEELYEGLAEGWHDVCGVVLRETANQADGGNAVLKDLVVEGYKNGADILGLCEVFVEAFVQRREHSLADGRV